MAFSGLLADQEARISARVSLHKYTRPVMKLLSTIALSIFVFKHESHAHDTSVYRQKSSYMGNEKALNT